MHCINFIRLSPPFPDKKYDIIYADPPFSYRVHVDDNNGTRNASHFYKTMNLEEIKKLPVLNIAKENSVLFLWSSSPTLPEALDVMSEWGFRYKTIAFTWVKTYPNSRRIKLGLGHYTRPSCEYVLLGTRGKGLERKDRSIFQVLVSPLEEHSKKPDEIKRRIERLYGQKQRIELFSRSADTQFGDAWGNEVDKFTRKEKPLDMFVK